MLTATLQNATLSERVGGAVAALVGAPSLATREKQRVDVVLRTAFATVSDRVAACAALDWWIVSALRLLTPPHDTAAAKRFASALRVVGALRNAAVRDARGDVGSADFQRAWRAAQRTLTSHASAKELVRVEQVLQLRLHHAGISNLAQALPVPTVPPAPA